MSTRLSITSQTEKAFAAMFKTYRSGVLTPVTPYAGQAGAPDEEIEPPDVIFCASAPQQFTYESLIYELILKATLETQVDESPVSPTTQTSDTHHLRVAALRDLIENFTVLFSRMNHPISGTDTRVVKDYTLSAVVFENEILTQQDRRLSTELEYYICAAAVDETPS